MSLETHRNEGRSDKGKLWFETTLICDVCQRPITEIGHGAAAFTEGHPRRRHSLPIMFVHKGICHDTAELRLMGRTGGPWDELRDYLRVTYAVDLEKHLVIEGRLRATDWYKALKQIRTLGRSPYQPEKQQMRSRW